ncbi:MAG: hypothetical protein ACLFTT_02740 [Candidatus Hydrogenedentota bacterium]
MATETVRSKPGLWIMAHAAVLTAFAIARTPAVGPLKGSDSP